MTRSGTDQRQRALLVNFEQYYDSYLDDRPKGGTKDGQQLHIKAYVVSCENDGSAIRNGGWDDREPVILGITGDDLQGFQIRCSATREDSKVRHTTERPEYSEIMSIDSRRAMGMVKVFKVIERRLAKFQQANGWHTTTGQYIVRVASALGATRIIIPRYGVTLPGHTYDDNASCYEHFARSEAEGVIDRRIAAWAEGASERQAVRY